MSESSEHSLKSFPLVSVAIPTYKRPGTLCRTLDSVISQTYPNLEILISDNDPDDYITSQICKTYCRTDMRIKYFKQSQNLGVWGNVNFLFQQAKGEFYFALSDDDWITDNYLEESVKIMRNDLLCSIVFSKCYLYDKHYTVYHTIFPKDILYDDYLPRMSAVLNDIPSGGFFRTSSIKECAYTGRFGEDWVFFLKMLFLGRMRIIPNACYHKLYDREEHTTAYYAKLFNALEVNNENWRDQLLSTIVDAIIHDPFFLNRLNKKERIDLAVDIVRSYPRIDIEIIEKNKFLHFLIRHPLFLIKKDYSINIKKPMSGNF